MSAGPAFPTVEVFLPPTDEHLRSVCKLGQEHNCCRYLSFGASGSAGWSCERHTSLAAAIDSNVLAGLFTARAINCDGRGAR